jgi:zinc protease
MKNLIIVLSVLLTVGCTKKETKQDGKFTLRPLKQVELENGLKVFFIEDASLPRVSLNMLIKAGVIHEPKGLDGLNTFTASMLEEGTKKHSALEIADELGELGTEIGISPGADFTFVSIDALSQDKEKVLKLYHEIVTNPAFQEKEIERIRSNLKAQIQKKVDNPSSFTDDSFDKIIYGDHPYGKDMMGTIPSVSKIKKADLVKHYETWFRPNNSALAVVGHITPEFEKEVLEIFKKWASKPVKHPVLGEIPEVKKLEVQLLSKADLKQTQIRLGRQGVKRKTDDFLVLRATSEILGGSGASRLMQRVRDDLGLTYGIYSGFEFRKDKGAFTISTFTKNESVGQTLKETLEVYNKFVESGTTEKELLAAKAQMIGQFPRALETADLYAYNILVLDFYEVPFSYLEDYMSNVEKITVTDVNDAIKKYLPKDQLKVLIYGDEKQVLEQLAAFKPEVTRMK